jgi:hypothetical protein
MIRADACGRFKAATPPRINCGVRFRDERIEKTSVRFGELLIETGHFAFNSIVDEWAQSGNKIAAPLVWII